MSKGKKSEIRSGEKDRSDHLGHCKDSGSSLYEMGIYLSDLHLRGNVPQHNKCHIYSPTDYIICNGEKLKALPQRWIKKRIPTVSTFKHSTGSPRSQQIAKKKEKTSKSGRNKTVTLSDDIICRKP